jgi:hypothetical protein
MSTTADLMGLGMPPALAGRLGNTPQTIAGVGTSQTGAGALSGGGLFVLTPTSSNTAFVLSNATSTGRPVYVYNSSATYIATIFPPSGGSINGGATNAGFTIPPLSGMLFQLVNGAGVPAETWYTIGNGGADVNSPVPQQVYHAVSTAPTTNNLNLTAANITGGSTLVALNLTAALSAGATATLPSVAATVAAMQAAGMSPVAGASFELDIYNSSSGNYAWTTTADGGATWTLSGTAQTIAQNTVRKYIVTLTSLTAGTMQSIGEFTVAAAP